MSADIVNMFPLSIYRHPLGLDEPTQSGLEEWVHEMKASSDVPRASAQAWIGDTNGFELIHEDARFAPIATNLNQRVTDYLGVLGVRAESFNVHVVRSWATLSSGQEHIAGHAHPHAHIAAVYYLRLPPDSAQLGFGCEALPNELAPGLFHDATRARGHLDDHNIFNSNEVFLDVRQDDLVLFPAKSLHFTRGRSDSEEVRISMVCDLVLTLRDTAYSEHLLPNITTWKTL